MPDKVATDLHETRFRHSGLRLGTLITMQWVAVAGQTATVAALVTVLEFDVSLLACAAVIGVAAAFNIGLSLTRRWVERLTPRAAVSLLSFDVVQFSVFLALTGGLENPFVFICIAPTIVSASSLGPRATLGLGLLTTGSLSLVSMLHFHLPWRGGEVLHLPLHYVASVGVALLYSLAFLAYYSWRVAEEARHMQDALAATEMVLARETQLSALDGLAAAAAHDLGTPLSTISVVARELDRELGNRPEIADDLALLRSEADRCRAILATLTDKGGDAMLAQMPLSDALEQVAESAYAAGTTIDVHMLADDVRDPQPVIARNPGLLYGLGNIIGNAVYFAATRVSVTGRWSDSEIVVEVADDGPGFPPDVLSRLGEPFVSKRNGKTQSGHGLGFFIAKTLLERTGGHITIVNRTAPASGAVVRIVWPRSMIDIRGQSIATAH